MLLLCSDENRFTMWRTSELGSHCPAVLEMRALYLSTSMIAAHGILSRPDQASTLAGSPPVRPFAGSMSDIGMLCQPSESLE